MTTPQLCVPSFGILLALAACRSTVDYNAGVIEFDPDRPEVQDADPVAPYTGDDAIVLEAQSKFATGLELHQKVVWRTCTPNGGVCHNSKEYPDLRTPAGFAAAFRAPCNIQPGESSSVFDGCERPGDEVRFGGGLDDGALEIAWIEYILGADDDYGGDVPDDAPGLHIHLAEPLGGDRDEAWGSARFARAFENDEDLEYARFETQWFVYPERDHVFGRVREYQLDEVQRLLDVGMVQADANRNGRLGAELDMDVQMLVPGEPESSYLIGRIRGEMFGEPIPGSRMPLANPPLTIPEMLALFCLVEGFPASGDQDYLAGPIDYANCSYSEDPEALNLLGNGVTWASRIQPILETNCGGCHSVQDAQGGLVLVGDDVYERLLMPSAQLPELALIEPEDPEASYLYLKLVGDDRIVGNPMPYNPLTGEGTLSEAELGDVLTWITNGAVEDE